MRTAAVFCPLLIAVLLLVGCPQTQFRFTNADVTNHGWRYSLLAGAAAGIEDTSGTGTNAVTREVVEPDVIRRVGNILYVLNQYRGLSIVDLDREKVLAQVPTYGYPRDLYVVGNHAYVLVASATKYESDGPTVSFDVASRLYVVDLTNPGSASLPSFDLKGDLVDSRLVGDVLYAVCAEYQYYYDGVAVAKAATSESWVTSVNVADPANIRQVDEVSFEGLGSVIQATNSAIYVAAPSWETNQTTITYVDISDSAGAIALAGSVTVKGYLADKFKMDAYEGVLRIVSNDWNWSQGRKNFITTVSLADPMNLAVLGETELSDASGETLFATRFDGPRAYVVTYLLKDPLFVIDLSDPAVPKVAGKLVVPGWSTHIEPRGDRLIALGVDDTDGGRRVCVSMFDVADPANPQQIGEKATFGENWSWSSAYSDVKAFTVLDDTLIVPFSGWSSGRSGYERLQFLSYGDSGVTAQGYVDVKGTVLRSFEYGDRYYGVTTEQLSVIDGANLDSPVVEKTVTLAEYVARIIEITSALRAEVLTLSETRKTLVRLVDSQDAVVGQAETEIGDLSAAHVYGSSVVLVGTDYDETTYKTFYLVSVVDCSTPEIPMVKPVIRVNASPYGSSWWWYSGDAVMNAVSPSGAKSGSVSGGEKSLAMPWWGWWLPGDTSLVLGNILALRCSDATFDVTFGDVTPYQGIALVDLATHQWNSTIGLGFNEVVSVHAVGNRLCIGTQDSAGYDLFKPLTANHLRLLDVSSLLMGPTVNVPGTFVQYEPERKLLVVRDDEWETGWNYKSSLRSLSWDGGSTVRPLDSMKLPSGFNTVLARGSRIFIDANSSSNPIPLLEAIGISSTENESGYYVYSAGLGDSGTFDLGDGLLVTKQWGSLFGAQGPKAYVTIGNALAVYDFASSGALVDIYESMSYPSSISFGSQYAYVSFGYAGLAKIPL